MEKICDLTCNPIKQAPGMYWKPNRYFERPYVTIDIIGTPSSTYMTTVEGAVAVDIAEAAILKLQSDYSIVTDIGFHIEAGKFGDPTIDVRLDGYGEKMSEFYKDVRENSLFRTNSDVNEAGKKQVRDHYQKRNVQVDK